MGYKIPTSDKYFRALSAIASDLPDTYIGMLRANYRAPNHTITPFEMARKVRYRTGGAGGAASLHYGKLALMLKRKLGIPTILTKPNEAHIELLVECDKPKDKMLWKLRPEVAKALQRLNWT